MGTDRLEAPADYETADIIVCKVHGSLRWLQYNRCRRIYSVDFWSAFASHFVEEKLPLVEDLIFHCWDSGCPYVPTLPVLLPIPGKEFSNLVLRQQMVAAIMAARQCKRVIVVGSALRDSDKQLLRVLRSASLHAHSIIVVNPSPIAVARAESICGICGKRVDHFDCLSEYTDYYTRSIDDKTISS